MKNKNNEFQKSLKFDQIKQFKTNSDFNQSMQINSLNNNTFNETFNNNSEISNFKKVHFDKNENSALKENNYFVCISEYESNLKTPEEANNQFSQTSLSKTIISPRKSNKNSNKKIYSEKDKKILLEQFGNLYSFKKKEKINLPVYHQDNYTSTNCQLNLPLITNRVNINIENNPTENSDKSCSCFPLKIEKADLEESFNLTETSSMFKTSIYTNLVSTGNSFCRNKNLKNDSRNFSENDLRNEDENKEKKHLKKVKFSKEEYGPFLDVDDKSFYRKTVIDDPNLKRGLEDVNYFGPYFSHCPMCRNKNLDFYKNMEPDQCMKLLNFIKFKKSKIKIK